MARAYAAAEEAFFFQFVGGYVDTAAAQRPTPFGSQRRRWNSTDKTHSTATLWGEY